MKLQIHSKELLMKIGTVSAAIALVLAGSWYTARQMERQTSEVSSPLSDRQVIILDAGHGASTETELFQKKRLPL